jgi:hypothetical protein
LETFIASADDAERKDTGAGRPILIF